MAFVKGYLIPRLVQYILVIYIGLTIVFIIPRLYLTLFEYLAGGLSLDYFLESFPSVTREQAVGVLLHGQRRIEEDLAA